MRRRAAIRHFLPILTAALAAAVAPCALAQSPAPAGARDRLLPLEVTINNTLVGSWALLERDGVLYAPAAAFDEWRINRGGGGAARLTRRIRRPRGADAVPVTYRGEAWYALTEVPGFQAKFNFVNQSVDLVFSSAAFAATRLTTEEATRAKLDPVEPALFVNYDLSLNYSRSPGSRGEQDLGFLSELGYATGLGVFTSSYVGRNMVERDPLRPRSVRRLETTFTRDYPDSNMTLRVGDSATRPGLLGRGTYFGGVQLSRNFGLTPGFVTQPIPLISGTSSAPSTVELYINDALRQTSNVPAGPFVIDNQALVSGSGQARLVVRDVLGRETVIVQPFFSHASLLSEGLSDWSVEAGAPRRNLGSENANYGRGFAAGLWRHGYSRSLTIESTGEVGRHTQTGGLGLLFELPAQTLGMAGVAASHDDARGVGSHWVLGVEHLSLRHGFSVNMQGASRNFRQLGLGDVASPTKRELSASYSYNSTTLGYFGVGLARIETYDKGTLSTLSGNYSISLPGGGAVTFSATRVMGISSGTSFGVNLTMPLTKEVNLSSAATRRAGGTDAYVRVSKALGAESGVGWRLLAGARESKAYGEGGLYYQGNSMLVSAEASQSATQQALRLGAQGGLVFVDGSLYTSRKLDNSFAVVEVPGYPNVGIGVHGAVLTRTDAAGKALVPRLIPYQANSIRLDPTELPINAEIDSIEQVVVPRLRSAVKLTFPVRSGRGALIKIVFDDGQPAPAGAQIELVGDKQEFFVARRGEAFVTGLQEANRLRLTWRGQTCGIPVLLPKGEVDEIARVGPVTCSGIKR